MTEKINILQITPQLGQGGAEVLVRSFAQISDPEFNINFFSFYRAKDLREGDIGADYLLPFSFAVSSLIQKLFSVSLIFFAPFFSFYLYFRYVRNYNVVHCHMTLANFYLPFFRFWSYLFSFSTRPKFITTFHTNMHLLSFINRLITKFCWKYADLVVFEIDADNEIKSSDLCSEKIRVVNFGIDLLNFKYDTGYENPLVIGTLSRLRIFEKRFDEQINAIQHLEQKGFQNLIYRIGGIGPDLEQINDLIEEKLSYTKVEFVGEVSHLEDFFATLDIFLCATVNGETGIAGLQAMSFGLPIFPIETKPFICVKQSSMFVESNFDLDDLLCLCSDRSYRIQRSFLHRKYVENFFSIESFLSKYKRIWSNT